MLIPISIFPYVDFIIIVLFILTLLSGYKQGLLLQLLNLISVVVALFIAWLFAPILANTFTIVPASLIPFENEFMVDILLAQVNEIACFALIFILLSLLLLLLKPIVKAIGKLPIIKSFNKLFGLIFSIAIFAVNIVVATFILSTPIFQNGNELIESSLLKDIREYTLESYDIIKEPLDENLALQQLLGNRENITLADIEFIEQWMSDAGLSQQEIQSVIDDLYN